MRARTCPWSRIRSLAGILPQGKEIHIQVAGGRRTFSTGSCGTWLLIPFTIGPHWMSPSPNLVHPPTDLPRASRFTAISGFFYAAIGLTMLAWPGMVQGLFGEPAFAGHEGSLVRVIGMLLAAVGSYYVVGGRSGSRQFVTATVINRLTLVPAVLLYCAATGVFPRVMLTFAVFDPVLALVAWRLLGPAGGSASSSGRG